MLSSRLINDAVRAQAAIAGLADRTVTDAGETAFFVAQLEDIATELYNTKYPELKARSLISMKTDIPTGATQHTWRGYDDLGEADETDDYSDDIPQLAELVGGEQTRAILGLVGSYGYSVQDIRAAQMARLPLDAMKAALARKTMERKLDDLLAFGSTARVKNLIYGFWNNPTVTAQNADLDVSAINTGAGPSGGAYSASTGVDWTFRTGTGKTPQKIAQDLNQARQIIYVNSQGVHDANSVVFDIKTDALLATTPLNVADATIYSDKSVKQFILAQCPWIQNWDVWNKAGAVNGAYNAAGAAACMVYEKGSENMQGLLPQDFEQFPPQLKNFKFAINCHMRSGGVIVRRPMAFQQIKKVGGTLY